MADDGLSRLTDDEKSALLALLKRAINDDRYPLSPRIGVLRGILAKLQPPQPAPATAAVLRTATRHSKAAHGARLVVKI
jgi:hypothetical protein